MNGTAHRVARHSSTPPNGLCHTLTPSPTPQVEVAKLLLAAGADVEPVVYGGLLRSSPLSVAVNFGNVEVVRLLLAAGANVNVQDRNGATPLNLSGSNAQITQLLIDATARAAQPPLTTQAVAAMGVRELKTYLGGRRVDFSGCCEKSELVVLALSTLGETESGGAAEESCGAVHKVCARCSVAASQAIKLKKCKTCRAVYYCGRECQVADWQAHKLGCGP